MTDGERLLRAVCDEPYDDAPRLVYSDWLEENGQPEQARFIRLRCRAEALPEYEGERYDLWAEAFRLERRHGEAWRAGLHWRVKGPLHRGFHEWCATDAGAWREVEAEVLASAPVTKLCLSDWVAGGGHLVRSAGLARIDGLLLVDASPSDPGPLRDLFRRPQFAGLRHYWHQNQFFGDQAARTLAEATHLTRMESLDLTNNGLTADTLAALARAAHLAGLRKLSLKSNPLGNDAGRLLAGTPLLASLEEVSLAGCGLGVGGLTAFLAGVPEGRLRRLNLGGDPFGNTGAAMLGRCERLSGLWALHLGGTGIDGRGLLALAGGAHLAGLRHLDLSSLRGTEALIRHVTTSPILGGLTSLVCRVSSTAPPRPRMWRNIATHLGEAAHLTGLRELVFQPGGFGDTSAAILASSPHLTRLRVLDLRHNHIGDAGVRALAASPHLSGLVQLLLAGNPFGDDGALALLESPHLSGLAYLVVDEPGERPDWSELERNSISPDLFAALAGRFGPAGELNIWPTEGPHSPWV